MIGLAHRFVSIIPQRELPLAGRGEKRLGIRQHDPLEANIVVVQQDGSRAVLVSVDALFIGHHLSAEIIACCEEKGVPPEAVLLIASHTHAAPALESTKPLLGEYDRNHVDSVRRKLLAAIREALAERPIPASVLLGQVHLSAGVNRRYLWPFPQLAPQGLLFDKVVLAPNKAGPVERLATAIVLRGEGQMAIIWHHACHPNAFPDCSAVSADYPGVVRRALRRRYGPNTTVVFLQGFAGDIRPPSGPARKRAGTIARMLLQGPCFHEMSMAGWQQWADEIAGGILKACDEAVPVETGAMDVRHARTSLSNLLPGAPESRAIDAQRLHLLASDIIAISAEPLIDLKELCPPGALCVGYSRDVFGYWPRTDQLALGGYEVTRFKRVFGVSHPWCSDPDMVLMDLLKAVSYPGDRT